MMKNCARCGELTEEEQDACWVVLSAVARLQREEEDDGSKMGYDLIPAPGTEPSEERRAEVEMILRDCAGLYIDMMKQMTGHDSQKQKDEGEDKEEEE